MVFLKETENYFVYAFTMMPKKRMSEKEIDNDGTFMFTVSY